MTVSMFPKIKEILSRNFRKIGFHKLKRVNEYERLSFKTTRDISAPFFEEEYASATGMNFIYKAAKLITKTILWCKK